MRSKTDEGKESKRERGKAHTKQKKKLKMVMHRRKKTQKNYYPKKNM